MNENSEENPASQQLAECISILEQSLANFEYARSRLSLCDKARNDLLHSLELYDNDATARARTAAKLKMCLLERRIYKDYVDVRGLAAYVACPYFVICLQITIQSALETFVSKALFYIYDGEMLRSKPDIKR